MSGSEWKPNGGKAWHGFAGTYNNVTTEACGIFFPCDSFEEGVEYGLAHLARARRKRPNYCRKDDVLSFHVTRVEKPLRYNIGRNR